MPDFSESQVTADQELSFTLVKVCFKQSSAMLALDRDKPRAARVRVVANFMVSLRLGGAVVGHTLKVEIPRI